MGVQVTSEEALGSLSGGQGPGRALVHPQSGPAVTSSNKGRGAGWAGRPLVDLEAVRAFTGSSSPETALVAALNTWMASVVPRPGLRAHTHPLLPSPPPPSPSLALSPFQPHPGSSIPVVCYATISASLAATATPA